MNFDEKMTKIDGISKIILELKQLPQSTSTKKTIQKLQQQIDEIMGLPQK